MQSDQLILRSLLERTCTSETPLKARIVCTIGPACAQKETLVKMIDAGMTIARLNFSHGNHESQGKLLSLLREAAQERPASHLGIMIDTKGPEIRTGLLKNHKPIHLEMGKEIILTTDYSFEGDARKIAVSYPDIVKIKKGSIILVSDGTIHLKVKNRNEEGVLCEILNDAVIGERKNMNIPGTEINLPTLTPKDIHDIKEFGAKQGVDMIALSFTRRAEDIQATRRLLGPGSATKVVAKIENHEGLINLEEIVREADGVMVARGDLGMEIPLPKMYMAQNWIIEKCNRAGKMVIMATQMMESMIKNPMPTRGEVTDIAHAVLQGADMLMLSGETANGSFPVEAVQKMAEVALEAEKVVSHKEQFLKKLGSGCFSATPMEAVASAVVLFSLEKQARIVVCLSSDAQVGRMLAKGRPRAPILIGLSNLLEVSHVQWYYGVFSFHTDSSKGIFNFRFHYIWKQTKKAI